MRIIYSTKFSRDMAFILPGEHYVSDSLIINTLLGSCVSVVLYGEKENIGGMNHFMLPSVSDPVAASGSDSGRYGIYAMELLINDLVKKGVKKGDFRAKIFGGARVIGSRNNGTDHIGSKNVDFVLNYLKTEKIPVISKDVGGENGRKIYFFPWTGKVLVSTILSTREIAEEEKTYINYIEKDKKDKKIILFDSD
jgi:chemotaxis protein CheD